MEKQAKLILDPRTKLFLVLCMGLSIVAFVPLYVEAVNITLFACLFLLNGQAKTAVKLIVFFFVLAALSYVPQNTGALASIVLPVSFMIRRFMLPIVAGKYLIDSTPVGLLMSALEKLKIPAKHRHNAVGDVPFFSDARRRIPQHQKCDENARYRFKCAECYAAPACNARIRDGAASIIGLAHWR